MQVPSLSDFLVFQTGLSVFQIGASALNGLGQAVVRAQDPHLEVIFGNSFAKIEEVGGERSAKAMTMVQAATA